MRRNFLFGLCKNLGETWVLNLRKVGNLPKVITLLTLFVFLSHGNAQTHAVDGEYITEWLLIGPFFPDHLETTSSPVWVGRRTSTPRREIRSPQRRGMH